MANFDAYIPTLLRCEARVPHDWERLSPRALFDYARQFGWVKDSGGWTQCGVTLTAYRRRFGREKTAKDLRDISFDDWRAVMKGDYWDKLRADAIVNQSVAEVLVDWVVNSGEGVIRKIQDIVCTEVDGIVGPITLNCINNYRAECLHCRTLAARRDYYERLVVAKPQYQTYLAGWLARLENFKFKDR